MPEPDTHTHADLFGHGPAIVVPLADPIEFPFTHSHPNAGSHTHPVFIDTASRYAAAHPAANRFRDRPDPR